MTASAAVPASQSRTGPARVARIAVLSGSAGSQITAALAERLGGPELTGNNTVVVLCSLAMHERLRPRDIQAVTGLTSGGTTNQLDRLAALGLVERWHDQVSGDRRAVVMSLTPAGERAADGIADTFGELAPSIRRFIVDLRVALDGAPATSAADREASVLVPNGIDRARLLQSVVRFAHLGTTVAEVLRSGVNPPDLMSNEVAAVLGELASGSRRPRDLGRLIGLSSGGTTKLLARLQAHRLVHLQHGGLEADRRATLVTLTSPGRRTLASAAASLDARRDELLQLIDDVEAGLAP
jgi:DNA-binding MarR family transcriptional regulator